jgi:nitrite reductase/ring-hydroxylating ferredoxin subunit
MSTGAASTRGRRRKLVIGRAEDLPPGERMIVDVDGHSIGVFNVDGKLFALLNRCPHQGAALCQGTVTRVLEADQPGAYRYDVGRPLLQCPWHSWEFDLRT